ncbi:MAG TPA: hypothetical protein PKZ27_02815 [Rhodocyclaceae bacterium]|nr:hypothetical protein [Burkholderiaceae bacterium]HRP74497.1 hypothetical protein [Rhodocyclaceae bacterium]
MATWCPISNTLAEVLVDDAHAKFMAQGTQTYNLAVANLEGLNDIAMAPFEFNVSFDYANPQAMFNRPQRPDLDDGALAFRDPNLPIGPAPGFTARELTFTDAPDIDVPDPILNFVARPTAPNVAVPSAPGDRIDITLPVPPDYVLPAVPTMDELQLPTLPAIELAEFTANRPEFVEPPFLETWSFTPEPYTERLVQELTDTLRPMIIGSQTLPLAIERAIFERGRSRIEVEANRNVEQAISEFATRGFTEPQGQLSGRVSEIRQGGQNATAEQSREAMIRQFELSLEQQRFAITQGAALEGTLIQLHVEEQRFLLEAAKFQMESSLAVVNFRVQVFNAQMQAYSIDAEVFRTRIQAELAKVELFRAQLEGERLRGEINMQRVQLYEAQLRSIGVMADFYKTQVDTVKVQADINMQGIERYKAELSAYETRWNAHVAEWRGYSSAVEGESKRVDIYRALVDATAKRVDAWATRNTFELDSERLRMQQHTVQTDVWRAGITRLEAMLGAERARLAAVSTGFDARARIYTADAGVEQAASAAADRSFELGLARERAEVDTQLKNAEMHIQQLQFLLAQAIEIQKAKAQIASQLAASTMAAVNYGASTSTSNQRGQSCSTQFQFAGEIADAGI